jgi:hypothetical protein
MDERHGPYRFESGGFAFLLDRENVLRLKGMADFETQEEPAVAEQFLRLRAEAWAETLNSVGGQGSPPDPVGAAGTPPAEIAVRVDPHQRKAHLVRDQTVVVSADI